MFFAVDPATTQAGAHRTGYVHLGVIADVQYLRVYVRQLRQKIERIPDQPQYITTETGVGYRLREAE